MQNMCSVNSIATHDGWESVKLVNKGGHRGPLLGFQHGNFKSEGGLWNIVLKINENFSNKHHQM